MDQATHEVRLQQWKEIIQAQLASGQSKRAWCQENGVSEKQFFYWQRRIRKEIYETQKNALELVKAANITQGLVELPVMQRTISKAEEGFCPEAVISIGNITVGITGNISEELLMSIGKMIRHAL